MERNHATVEFVKKTLGCACPDEVFEQIEYGDNEHFKGILLRSITVGGRLLIYVWEVNDPAVVASRFTDVLALGKDERDRRGLNRFRAVLSTDDVDRLKSLAQGLFEGWQEKDEKTHLHVVASEDVPSFNA